MINWKKLQNFHIYLKMLENKIFINIPTFYSWVRKQKDKINNDIYKVRTLNVPKEQAPLYREMPKLLTTKKQIK